MKPYNHVILLAAFFLSKFVYASDENIRTITLHYEANLFVEYMDNSSQHSLMLSQMELSGKEFVRKEILVSLSIAPLGPEENFNWSDCFPRSNSNESNSISTMIIGVLKFDRPPEPSKPERAWLVNWKEKTLQGIDISNVLCRHDIP